MACDTVLSGNIRIVLRVACDIIRFVNIYSILFFRSRQTLDNVRIDPREACDRVTPGLFNEASLLSALQSPGIPAPGDRLRSTASVSQGSQSSGMTSSGMISALQSGASNNDRMRHDPGLMAPGLSPGAIAQMPGGVNMFQSYIGGLHQSALNYPHYASLLQQQGHLLQQGGHFFSPQTGHILPQGGSHHHQLGPMGVGVMNVGLHHAAAARDFAAVQSMPPGGGQGGGPMYATTYLNEPPASSDTFTQNRRS